MIRQKKFFSKKAKIKDNWPKQWGFNIEVYCQEKEGTINSEKSVSRVVITNNLGQRVFDTEIKLENPAFSSNNKQS